eukprot:TRINITY_DN11107_c0_g1_i1.p1 TRINITY_DN11107_c0_g1~~TRINITY_DN11107_c0_g1_i1.p1  ORF type:complete len:387 (+),score=47.44 TRINITY_DN11107_c0_g1_i1:70-1161(+)
MLSRLMTEWHCFPFVGSGRGPDVSKLAKAPTLDDLRAFENYIFDCDGVIWGIPDEDTKTSVATVNFLLGLGKRVMFVTNNSNKTRAQFVRQLESKGINFGQRSQEERIAMMVSTSYTTAAYLRDMDLRRPFILTSETGVQLECRSLGVTEYVSTVTDDGKTTSGFETLDMTAAPDIIRANPGVDCVVVGWDMQFTALKIATAVNYIKWHEEINGHKPGYQPMPLIACSGDTGGVLGSTRLGELALKIRAVGNGAMADAIGRSFDPPKQWVDMGKPSETLLCQLRSPKAYNVDLSKTLMVGDTLQTDIVFGNQGGMQTLLVLSGVTSRSELDAESMSDNPVRRPTFVLPKLGHFVENGQIPMIG